jgi:hypothetical protein
MTIKWRLPIGTTVVALLLASVGATAAISLPAQEAHAMICWKQNGAYLCTAGGTPPRGP